jgi:hypothetical protein
MSETVQFDETEERVLRYLHGLFQNGEESCKKETIKEKSSLSSNEWNHVWGRFKVLGIFGQESTTDIQIAPVVCEFVSVLDHRPPVNHWKRIHDWWFSKRWTLPATAVVLGVPIIAQWITWGYALFKCFQGEPPNP